MLRRLIAINLAVLFFFLPAYCMAQTVDPGAVRVGDRWSYDIKDDLTGDLRHAITIVVVEVNEKEITTRATYRGKDRPQTMVFDSNWGRIDDGAWKLRPSGIGISRPLEIGKEWRSDANAMNLQSGVAFRATGVAKVMTQEQVTGPAGAFDTFRIDMTVRLINTRDQTKSSTWTFVVWYAPAINRWVKKTTQDALRGAAQRLVFRGADRAFAKKLASCEHYTSNQRVIADIRGGSWQARRTEGLSTHEPRVRRTAWRCHVGCVQCSEPNGDRPLREAHSAVHPTHACHRDCCH